MDGRTGLQSGDLQALAAGKHAGDWWHSQSENSQSQFTDRGLGQALIELRGSSLVTHSLRPRILELEKIQ